MRWYRAAFWIFASIFGLLQSWQHRFFLEPDGLNYLDVASAYLRHDWSAAINSYWSPLYSWLLAAMLFLFHPSPYWESTALHVLGFLLFLISLRCAEFFIQEVISGLPEDGMPPWLLWAIGYSLLLFVALFMVPVQLDTPDVCVSALIYLAAGLLLRIRSDLAGTFTYVAFGIVLGIAYLAKTFMFIMAFPFFMAAVRLQRAAIRRTAIAVACFLAISIPWIVILSHSVKHATYGDVGSLAYAWFVDHSGAPVHPPRVLFSSPEVHEFSGPIRATYPPWYDGYYWNQGIRPRFRLRAQLAALERAAREYVHILFGQKEFIAAWMVLFLASFPNVGLRLRWPICLPVFGARALCAGRIC